MTKDSISWLCRAVWLTAGLIAGASTWFLAPDVQAEEKRFEELVNLMPRSANAVILLNLEKAKQSPLGVREGWDKKIENAFASGITRVPPQATRFVLAADIDFEFLEPVWEAAVMDADIDVSMKQIATRRGGTLDTIEGLSAVDLPDDTYVVQFGPRTLAAFGPGKRQTIIRWIRAVWGTDTQPVSAYLAKLASYSDVAGSEIIMGLDLEGVFSAERVEAYLKERPELLDEWKMDVPTLSKLLSSVQGVRLGVRIGETMSAKMVVDVLGDASATGPYAKPLILQILADRGVAIDDLEEWQFSAKDGEIALGGTLSATGLRRIMSLIDSPVTPETTTPAPATAANANDQTSIEAQATLAHFQAINAMVNDLKQDKKGARSVSVYSTYFDKYARKIERLSVLNVDPEMLEYSAFVASQLRDASSVIRNMGISSAVRERNVQSAGTGYYTGVAGGYRYGAYGGYGYGTNYTLYSPRADARGTLQERGRIRTEERGMAAANVQQLRDAIIDATADIRRKMAQKYQMDF